MLDTELRLSAWRDGSTQAERLATAILKTSGYDEVDPQSPLGGPDGGKDILASKGGITWVVAVYFASTPVSFASVKRKFNADLAKVDHHRRGFAFVTNQPLTPGQRSKLETIATTSNKEIDIFHLERIRAQLDSPSGYGVRLQFLKIPMSVEEQLSWFEESGDRVIQALNLNTRELLSIKALIQDLARDSADIIRTMSSVGATPAATPDLLSTTNFSKSDNYAPISARIDIPFVLMTHRLACFDLPSRSVGVLRTTDIWLTNASGERADHLQPPSAREVAESLAKVCAEWRDHYEDLAKASTDSRLAAIATFHSRFLVIHPFIDGNGRSARALLMQQCLDLFGVADLSLMDRGSAYYRALASADRGDLADLVNLLKPVVGVRGYSPRSSRAREEIVRSASGVAAPQ